jgi:hypothetical protein
VEAIRDKIGRQKVEIQWVAAQGKVIPPKTA